MEKFFNQSMLNNSWTLPGGLTASGEEDQRRLIEFLERMPDIRQAVVDSIYSTSRRSVNVIQQVGSINQSLTDTSDIKITDLGSSKPWKDDNARNVPDRPVLLGEAIDKFEARLNKSDVKQRTAKDQLRVVRSLQKYVEIEKSASALTLYAHLIDTPEVSGFLEQESRRKGRYASNPNDASGLKASTVKKRIMDLSRFFSFATNELKAYRHNPLDGLKDHLKELGKSAARTKVSYAPFTSADLSKIFAPDTYLANNRDPDYFWLPLWGAHTGGRLGEYAQARVEDIKQDAVGIWYLLVREENAKNTNSVRCVPIPSPMIELGFIDYVEHITKLGATQLWPHRDLTSETARLKPSKNQSQTFGSYLKKINLKRQDLVFHSFRHTVVTALLDAGTPLHVSMQICGHEVQQAAIARGIIKDSDIRSVHLNTYAHANVPRLGRTNPIADMKSALESSLKLPINYPKLKIAAQIVKEHTKREGDRFLTGWAAQNSTYTATQLDRLKMESAAEVERDSIKSSREY